MKKIFIILVAIFCSSFCACSKLETVRETEMWDCSVVCAEESKENSYVVTYSDQKVSSHTGNLSFHNPNAFDIVVHLSENGQEQTVEIGAGGSATLYQIQKNIEYTVGCYADVSEGTEIRLRVYDGEENR